MCSSQLHCGHGADIRIIHPLTLPLVIKYKGFSALDHLDLPDYL